MLGNILVLLSKSVRNLGLAFENQLYFDEQINNVTRKVIVNLINISCIVKVIDEDSKLKLVHWLVFSKNDFRIN